MTKPATSSSSATSVVPESRTQLVGHAEEPSQLVRWYTTCAFLLITLVALASAARWRQHPVFVDPYYHMATIQGFFQAGGIVTHAFWEMAPAGRMHIYPPGLHAMGAMMASLGVTPRTFVTFVGWAAYAGCLLTTWLWVRNIAGSRAALFSLILLCGPPAFLWNQAAHTTNAAMLVAAPLALLAHSTQHYWACGVMSLLTIAMHPMGLFLPPALVVNTLVSRRRIFAGLVSATVPVICYLPWLAHIWASKHALPSHRTGLSFSFGGFGVNLGLLLAVFAVLGIVCAIRRRGKPLDMIGALVGFAVVLPLGYSGRFLMFNVHWPLACLGGFGLACLVRRLEESSSKRVAARGVSLVACCSALLVFPSLEMPLPPGQPGTPPGPMPEASRGWHVTVHPGALPVLLVGGPRPGPQSPAGGADLIHRPGAEDFFAAVQQHVAIGDVIFMQDPPGATLVTGATGQWTSDGILRDVTSPEPPAIAEECDFAAVLTQRTTATPFDPSKPPPGVSMPPGRPLPIPFQAPAAHKGFEKLFENEFGSLWRSPNRPSHARQPLRPVVSLLWLTLLSATGLALIAAEAALRSRQSGCAMHS